MLGGVVHSGAVGPSVCPAAGSVAAAELRALGRDGGVLAPRRERVAATPTGPAVGPALGTGGSRAHDNPQAHDGHEAMARPENRGPRLGKYGRTSRWAFALLPQASNLEARQIQIYQTYALDALGCAFRFLRMRDVEESCTGTSDFAN